jgi:hypothetical protein
MTNTLRTDRYYRNYRMSIREDGHTIIYHGPDRIDEVWSVNEAKDTIDGWLLADDGR